MFINLLVFLAALTGIYLMLSSVFPGISPAAGRAVRARAGKKESSSIILIKKAALRIEPYISIDEMASQKLKHTLAALSFTETPKMLHARAWATGLLYAAGIVLFLPAVHLLTLVAFPGILSASAVYQIGIFLAAVMFFLGRNAVFKELETMLQSKREAIEWELPQFAGTVLQSLRHGSSRNVTGILESYKKICGPVLKPEIERTLNDMYTGNHEVAVQRLAARINSGAFTQLAQGLVGVIQGDNQVSYFQIITNDFAKHQQELMRREVLKRPGKLTINNVLLLIGMMAMLIAAIGSALLDSTSMLF